MRTSIWCALSFFVTCAGLWAQAVSTSQIKGTIQDATGLAVPGAEVRVTQTGIGLVRTATSGTDGGYVLPDLPVGPYQLEVAKDGFSKYRQTGIILQVATNPTIDVTLKIGSVTEQVQVEANASMVETQNSGVGQVIDSKRVVDLPLIGRQVTDLIILAGAATTGTDATLNTNRNYPTQPISVAGGLASGLSYVLDGAMHNDPYNNLNYPLPFPDAMQEFKVETSALPAQYGMHSAAAVNAITKSGSNDFHGTAFEFVRNNIFNARNFFSITRDTLKRNQFGGALGGPIRNNKLFFFGAYQGTTTRQDAVRIPSFLPTPAMLNGDFSFFASDKCQRAPVRLKDPRDPTGKTFFPGNQIPTSLLSQPALNIVKLLPTDLIADACGRVTYGSRNIQDERQAVGRADYQLSATHSLFARYVAANLIQPVPYALTKNLLTTITAGGAAGSGIDDLVQTFALGDTYVITPTVVSTFRATLNRSAIARIGAQFFGPRDVGINIFSYLPKYTSITVTGGPSIGGFTDTDSSYRTTTLQFGEDVGVIRGTHQMAFGANLAHWNSNTYARVLGMGTISFTGQATGLGTADFLLGKIFQFTQAPPNTLFIRQWYLGLYAQDTWKLRPNLTVSYGLRWEPYFPMRFANGLIYHFDQSAFDRGAHTQQFKSAPAGIFYPGDPGFPDNTGMNKQLKDFMPRIGIVWDPRGDGRTSIRASYGMFYDLIPAQYHLNTETAPPFYVRIGLISPPGGLADPYLGQPGGNPFPLQPDPNAPFPPFGTFNTADYDNHTTYVESWNLSIQRQIGSNWLASASYLGSHMVHLFTETELNPAIYLPGLCAGVPCSSSANTNQRRKLVQQNPNDGRFYGFVDKWDDGGTGSYHGLLLSVERRLNRGITMSANYALSHCISDLVNSVPNGGAGGSGVYLYANNRALDRSNCNSSGTDQRHVANMTAVAETPKFTNKVLRILGSGWRASAIVKMASGQFFTVLTGVDNALTGVGNQRPNQMLSSQYGDRSINNYLNAKAFGSPGPGTYGNLGNATVEGPGNLNFDAGLSRLFRIRERHTVEFRAEASNVLNRLNAGLTPANLTLNNNLFGRLTSTAPGQIGNPRILQFAMKYLF